MNFYHYADEYRMGEINNWLRHDGVRPKSPDEFFHRAVWGEYVMAAQAALAQNKQKSDYHTATADQLLAEHYWITQGRPYVKVFPKMARLLSRIRLNVPMKLLKLPYMAFAIRFPSDPEHVIREAPGKPPIQSLFVFQSMEHFIPNSDMISLGHYVRRGMDAQQIARVMSPIRPRPTRPIRSISVYYNSGEKFNDINDAFVTLIYNEENTISSALNNIRSSEPVILSNDTYEKSYIPDWSFIEGLMSITLASCLMIEGDENNVLPDLPRKLIPRYEVSKKMPDKQREKVLREIMEQARKRGHLGVAIGQRHELELPRPIYERPENTSGEATRHYELQYSHYRSPHPRLQPYGSRENPKYKVILLDLTQVRPDLPLDPRPKNVRLSDRSLG